MPSHNKPQSSFRSVSAICYPAATIWTLLQISWESHKCLQEIAAAARHVLCHLGNRKSVIMYRYSTCAAGKSSQVLHGNLGGFRFSSSTLTADHQALALPMLAHGLVCLVSSQEHMGSEAFHLL